ncbi:bifunctional GTP diphosphokinase/guanosine-3',5'-bis pyrophosphate 3'-pyrophosphohydrolase [Psychrobium sp. 1_MG-2023]|uniref:bifunctional GTP diphosphokinase/guanosine-3',5'-bis pyrophosphate 3'-pyrophosphohydrolase n=1 Tax=Psychrobium sp. 1_MG-2023 TaxID=3062624 RepID=UPI000C3277B1|nr:bifunctional GTP diphosphokinase/guanosine-3',5'-bis pyrophosphate 3'-pyrophosphohydrolase [Psychrobium sp. 1_MG-2023]MDP2562831.1 bifunctional GTP diphosphokinase/guanosine-3',5'-bis pyrophosphate 3'-pyrophosphohydrolase [Psychrobium sp. 1_MG-2023]PKF57950.1 guanosine-3',5'-bis(diphosphate) 3'-diphosphatase [Alteromonadales bacterium alter-6D02]
MYLIENLVEVVSSYLEPSHVKEIEQAYRVAKAAHEGQFRSSGEPYVTHPVAVCQILADMRLDHETLIAALLHDVIEDTPVTQEELAAEFGETVGELVEGVSKLDKLKFRNQQEAQAENFRKMMMAMVQDLRVILIKLADRTHNMRTLGSLRPDKRRRISRETLDIYAPIANRLGIHNIKYELEELGFKGLYPNRFRVLSEVVRYAKGNRKEVLQNVEQEISGRIEEAGIKAEIVGRQKNLYSIYNKMRSKEIQFEDVMDIYAFRIIVDDIDTCYRCLGAMHTLYKPRPGRFKDYIALPKANGYQSLHTSLLGPHGIPVEVQIRTDHMDQMADKGVAAHWVYKNDDDQGTTAQIRARRWIQSLHELQQSAGNSFEFIENVKTDLFPEEIYVFTPDSRLLELPAGSTAVDFAYAVHTDVGNSCVGARIDRQAYPLSQPLANGQTVEVITAPGSQPNAAWLNFVVTARARSKIRQVLKSRHTEESIKLGRRLLKHAMGDIDLDTLDPAKVEQVVKDTNNESFDSLLSNIGLGNAMSLAIAHQLSDGNLSNGNSDHKVAIKGAEGMLVTYAKCCRPIPGDPIIAHLSPGKGLVIHIESCANIAGFEKEKDKYLHVQWDNDGEEEYVTAIRVDMVNHQGILAAVTTAIAQAGANIHSMTTEEKEGKIYTIDANLSVKDRIHMANVLRKVRVLPDVIKVLRTKH